MYHRYIYPVGFPVCSLVNYSLNCSLITRYSTNTQLQESATSYQRYVCVPPLLLPQYCCYIAPQWLRRRWVGYCNMVVELNRDSLAMQRAVLLHHNG